MSVTISLAHSSDRRQLRTLLGGYLAELSDGITPNPDYPYFDAYWQKGEARWPYLIKDDKDVIGFALVNSWSPSGQGTDFSMAEFHIKPQLRHAGYGTRAADLVLNAHPGIWEIAVLYSNSAAQRFWPNAIVEAGASAVECFEQIDRLVYRFGVQGNQLAGPRS